MPRRSLPPIAPSTKKQRRHSRYSRNPSARAAAAAGLCAPSATTSGRCPITSSRPATRVRAIPPLIASSSMAAPRARSSRATATAVAAFPTWCDPSSGVRSSRDPSGPCTRNDCPKTYRSSTSVLHSSSTSRSSAPTSRQRSRTTCVTAGSGCGASTQVPPGPMIPALSRAIATVVSPSTAVWSSAIGVITAISAPPYTFVAS